MLVCSINCMTVFLLHMRETFYFEHERSFCYYFILFSNYHPLEVNLYHAVITIKIEVLKGFKYHVSVFQVASVHALFLLIKIRFPALATMWRVPPWSITYKWKSHLICENVFLTLVIAFSGEMRPGLIHFFSSLVCVVFCPHILFVFKCMYAIIYITLVNELT